MLTITKEFRFDAAHRLFLKELTEQENREIFGKCCQLHGHTYCLRITITGQMQVHGMILNFADLKQIVEDKIISRYDHAQLNELEEYRDLPTTAENMSLHIFKVLAPCLKKHRVCLTEVQLYETPTSWATVRDDA